MWPPVFQDQLPVTDHGRHHYENVMDFVFSGSVLIFFPASLRHALLRYCSVSFITAFWMIWHALPMNYVNDVISSAFYHGGK